MGVFASYEGEISIPEEKKEEFNANMIKLLQLGGMMSVESVSLYDKKLQLIAPVALDKEGKCHFHYNYFEDDAWETAGYESDSNRLWSQKIGSNEFNFVICAGYVLTELYSTDFGWVNDNGDILRDPDYVQWINYILDKDFSLEKRFELWKYCEKYCLQKLEYGYSVLDLTEDVLQFIPRGFEEYMGGTDLADILYILHGTQDGMDSALDGSYAKVVYDLREKLEAFYARHPQDGKQQIWQLITMPIDKRRMIEGTDYDQLAEASLQIPARVFGYLSTELLQLSFWDEWRNIYKDVYQDEISMDYVSESVIEKRKQGRTVSLGKMKTREFLKNDGYFTFSDTPDEIKGKGNYYISDDDLMYWWDGSEKIEISDEMVRKIEKWKKNYDEIFGSLSEEEVGEYDMLKNLMCTLEQANDFYKRIFAFKDMFYEFLTNSKDKRYIAMLHLFEKVIEDNKKDGTIIEYVSGSWDLASKNVTFNKGRVTIKRFLSLAANKELRKVYFGF